jgi:hypothetical protein
MPINLTKATKTVRLRPDGALSPSLPGVTDVNSDVVDMADFDAVRSSPAMAPSRLAP